MPGTWGVDARLTPTFTADDVRALLSRAVSDVDRRHPGPLPARFDEHDIWPAYRLPDASPVARALLTAAQRHCDPPPPADVCGPSNIGNLLAAHDIDATCGFGVGYRNIHAPDESASVADIPTVYRVYRGAIRELLRAR
jgi:succinyl-diaminopimelate desuccinylase